MWVTLRMLAIKGTIDFIAGHGNFGFVWIALAEESAESNE